MRLLSGVESPSAKIGSLTSCTLVNGDGRPSGEDAQPKLMVKDLFDQLSLLVDDKKMIVRRLNAVGHPDRPVVHLSGD
jgi:hypothetical protein